MDIGEVMDGIVSTFSEAAEGIKDATLWAGRMIESGFDKLVEIIKLCWDKSLPFLKDAFLQAAKFLKSTPGLAVLAGLAGLAGFGLLLGAEFTDKKWEAVAMRITGVVCIAGCFFIAGALVL